MNNSILSEKQRIQILGYGDRKRTHDEESYLLNDLNPECAPKVHLE